MDKPPAAPQSPQSPQSVESVESAESAVFSDLRLKFGDTLQVQFGGDPDRSRVRLIGYLEGRSIITTVPAKNNRLIPVRPGQVLTIRMMENGRAWAFVTEVLSVQRLPYPHIHVRYPSDWITNNVRKAARVETRVDGILINNSIGDRGKEVPCHLLDISETGALLVAPMRIGKLGDEIGLSLQLDISGISRILTVRSILRARLKIKPKADEVIDDSGVEREVHYGIEFLPLDDNEHIALIAFVYLKLSS
jgi:c-di-GMP-binding flagellar brake protein YcgR